MSSQAKTAEIDEILGFNNTDKAVTVEEKSYFREAMLSLRLAKEVIRVHNKWRANAVSYLNHTGGYSRSLANSCTDWPCLLLDILSSSAELDYFLVSSLCVSSLHFKCCFSYNVHCLFSDRA